MYAEDESSVTSVLFLHALPKFDNRTTQSLAMLQSLPAVQLPVDVFL
jgi:hypothetical protein